MKMLIYKLTFFNIIFLLFISCNEINNKLSNDIISEEIYSSNNIEVIFIKTNSSNILNFEIDNKKYTFLEIKTSNGDSIYNIYSSTAETWQNHENLRFINDEFNIRFHKIENEVLFFDFLTFGKGYSSEYDIINDVMTYEKIE